MKKFRYVMQVVETVVSTTAIESERKLTYEEVKDETERRRVVGTLSLKGVTDVGIYVDTAYEDGREVRDHIFAT